MSNIASLRASLKNAKKQCIPHAIAILKTEVLKEERRIVREGDFKALRLMGSCRDGREAEGGWLIHCVPSYQALCGAQYGRRSAGWTDVDGKPINCEKCLRKMAKHATPPAAAKQTNKEV